MKLKIIVSLFFVVLLSLPVNVLAQTPVYTGAPVPGQDIQIAEGRVKFAFSDLRFREKRFFSPFDSSSILFSVPSNWRLSSGGMLELHYDVLLGGVGLTNTQVANPIIGGDLYVRFNNILIGVLSTNESGSFVKQLPIPDEALVSSREDGRHILSLEFDSQLGCYYSNDITVILKPTSLFDLAYVEDSPQLDLTRLPAPFYLENSIVPDSALLVVPDDPDQLELQAAMNVAAGLGAMIGNDYSLNLVKYSELDDIQRNNNHLIFIGLAENFIGLTNVDFEIPLRNGKFEGLPAESIGDGVLQLAISPWNPFKAVLLVSGNTLEALSKAALAFSDRSVFIYQDPTVALVSDVKFLGSDVPIVEQFTLEDLGYSNETLSGVGTSSAVFSFYASKEQLVSKESYFNLLFFHFTALDYGPYSYELSLNGQLFYSGVFSDESTQATNVEIRIPPGFLNYGENRLEIRAVMIYTPSCENLVIVDPWFTILNGSLFNLPISDTSEVSQIVSPDLKFFTDLYTTSSDLGDVAFVVPRSDSASWGAASRLSYMFGEIVNPAISNMNVVYGDSVDATLLSEKSLIVVGKPNDIPLLHDLNAQLPAPFDFATNTASEQQLQVAYRIPQGQNVGYLEMLRSPYNSEKIISIIAGNTSDGVSLAADVLLLSTLNDRLAGVFTVTNGTQIASGNADSLFSIVGQGVPNAEQVINIPAVNTDESPSGQLVPPGWLLSFVILSGLLILGIGAYVIWSLFLKRQPDLIIEKVEVASNEAEVDESKPE